MIFEGLDGPCLSLDCFHVADVDCELLSEIMVISRIILLSEPIVDIIFNLIVLMLVHIFTSHVDVLDRQTHANQGTNRRKGPTNFPLDNELLLFEAGFSEERLKVVIDHGYIVIEFQHQGVRT